MSAAVRMPCAGLSWIAVRIGHQPGSSAGADIPGWNAPAAAAAGAGTSGAERQPWPVVTLAAWLDATVRRVQPARRPGDRRGSRPVTLIGTAVALDRGPGVPRCSPRRAEDRPRRALGDARLPQRPTGRTIPHGEQPRSSPDRGERSPKERWPLTLLSDRRSPGVHHHCPRLWGQWLSRSRASSSTSAESRGPWHRSGTDWQRHARLT